MALANLDKITARVNWIIGARGNAATFNSSVGSENFALEEVQRAIFETEAEIARDLAESDNPLKNTMYDWSEELNHGDMLPLHIGKVESVEIRPSPGAPFVAGESTSRENIRRWRENYNFVFDPLNHNKIGSGLSGYFNLTNQTIVFTGATAKVKICNFTPNFSTLQLTSDFESMLVSGAVAKMLKIGVPTALVGHYAQQYQMMKGLLRQGSAQLPEIDDAQQID